MTIREHNSQHDYAESLPLISESARVVAVDAMDRDRRSEIRRKLLELGQEYGVRDAIPETGAIDWDRVFETVIRERRRLAPRIAAFRERFERAFPSLIRIAFETSEPIEFAAGQYLSIRYGGRTRAYSIASSPNRTPTELCVRRVPGGSCPRGSPRSCRSATRSPCGDRTGSCFWKTPRHGTWPFSRRERASRPSGA